MVLLLFCVVSICIVLYVLIKNKYDFWKKQNVNGPTPLPVVGNFAKIIAQTQSLNDFMKEIYNDYSEQKIVGLYRGFKPMLLIRDPELIKHVLIKDFPIFINRGLRRSDGTVGKNLFEADDEIWRVLRQKLTPVFTSRRLKDMTPLIQQCVDNYIKYVTHISETNMDHEIRSLKAKYTLKVIGSCAFGLDLDTFADKEDEFKRMADKIFNPSSFSRMILMLDMIIPGIRKLFNSAESTELTNFFMDLVKKVIQQREGFPMQRKDFMDLMIQLKEQRTVSRKVEDGVLELTMDDELIAAQALVFYAAGFETSSATMSFMIHELAWHQDVQNKAYQEICTVLEKYNGKLSYDAINEMTYMEQVFDETLRKHPVIGVLFRTAQADYQLPGSNITIQKGMSVMMSVTGMHRDEKYFADPETFNPDNFSPENAKKLPACVYMPFGDGPRNCIGMRFAVVQSKMAMAEFLRNFKVEPSARTKRELTYDPKSLTVTSIDGIWVKILKR